MAEFREDTQIYPVLIALAECGVAELEKAGLDPAIVTIQPGLLPVTDYAGNGKDCSELIVSFTQAYPVSPFPTPDAAGLCNSDFAYDVELALFRCAPVYTGSKQAPKPPTPEAQLNAVRQHTADMYAMRRAIQCCMSTLSRSYAIRNFIPYGPSGGVVGGVWHAVVGQEL